MLATRTILIQGKPFPQAIIQWQGQPQLDATEETITDLR